MKKLLFTILTVVLYLVFASALVSCNEQVPNPTPENSGASESTQGTTLPQPETDPSTNDPAASEPSASDPATNDPSTNQQPENEQPENEKVSLDGKRVIFIGNSHTYYGKTVINKSDVTQEARSNDKGMFYQLCKLNGAEVTVTNWTFGSHNLIDTFGDCKKCDIKDHTAYLVDRKYDYVVIQEGSASGTPESFLSICGTVINFFKEANPVYFLKNHFLKKVKEANHIYYF